MHCLCSMLLSRSGLQVHQHLVLNIMPGRWHLQVQHMRIHVCTTAQVSSAEACLPNSTSGLLQKSTLPTVRFGLTTKQPFRTLSQSAVTSACRRIEEQQHAWGVAGTCTILTPQRACKRLHLQHNGCRRSSSCQNIPNVPGLLTALISMPCFKLPPATHSAVQLDDRLQPCQLPCLCAGYPTENCCWQGSGHCSSN
jgi:hypothetical protein